jgi:uncharacterized RDD family membrane protein YckC
VADTATHRLAHVYPAGAGERQGLRAGVVSRTVAMVIDAAYVVVLVGAAYLGYSAFRFLRSPRRFSWPVISSTQFITLALVVAVFILVLGWTSVGRTAGMRIMGLRIVGRSGTTPGFMVALLRAITCVVFPIGLFWSAVSKRNSSVHDLIFRTSVIYDWQARVPGASKRS